MSINLKKNAREIGRHLRNRKRSILLQDRQDAAIDVIQLCHAPKLA